MSIQTRTHLQKTSTEGLLRILERIREATSHGYLRPDEKAQYEFSRRRVKAELRRRGVRA